MPVVMELSSDSDSFNGIIYSKSEEVMEDVSATFMLYGIVRVIDLEFMENLARLNSLRLYEVDYLAGSFEFQEMALFPGGDFVH
jgi:hypothetical protein